MSNQTATTLNEHISNATQRANGVISPYGLRQLAKDQIVTRLEETIDNPRHHLSNALNLANGIIAPYERRELCEEPEQIPQENSIVLEKMEIQPVPTALCKKDGIIPEMRPAIIKLNSDGSVVGEENEILNSSVSVYQRIDNSAIANKYPEAKELLDIIYSKNLDVRFVEAMENYIGAEVMENGYVNPLISFAIDLTESFLNKDKKIHLNTIAAPRTVTIRFNQKQIFNDYLDKKLLNEEIFKVDIFSNEEREVNKLINLSTLPTKSDDARKSVVALFISDGFQKVLAEALKDDPTAHFKFTSFKGLKNFKLISDEAKTITISYDISNKNGNIQYTVKENK